MKETSASSQRRERTTEDWQFGRPQRWGSGSIHSGRGGQSPSPDWGLPAHWTGLPPRTSTNILAAGAAAFTSNLPRLEAAPEVKAEAEGEQVEVGKRKARAYKARLS